MNTQEELEKLYIPKKGGYYWYVSSTGFRGCETNIQLNVDDLLRIGQGNAFKTYEEAEDYYARMVQNGRRKADVLSDLSKDNK